MPRTPAITLAVLLSAPLAHAQSPDLLPNGPFTPGGPPPAEGLASAPGWFGSVTAGGAVFVGAIFDDYESRVGVGSGAGSFRLRGGYRGESGRGLLAEYQVYVFPESALHSLDLDYQTANLASSPDWERRWQLGVRMFAVSSAREFAPLAIGPHAGVDWLRLPGEGGVGCHARLDGGLIFSPVGIPFVDLRAELGLVWSPAARPGLSLEVGVQNEFAWLWIVSVAAPGGYVRARWDF